MKRNQATVLLSGLLALSLLAGCSGSPSGNATPTPAGTAAPQSTPESGTPYALNATGSVRLNATGMCTYTFEEEQDEAWADNVTHVYLREMPADPAAEPVSDSDEVDMLKYTVSTTRVILDSDLFAVDPSNQKEYEVTICSEGAEDYHLSLTVANLRPVDFTIRTIDGEGNVVDTYTLTYDEMEELSTQEGYYSAACVMHGLNSYHGRGVLLRDLLDHVGLEFTEGMSLAMRVADAPATIEATERFNGNKTGVVFENPESYWIKPRYTDNYKWTYENLYGRTRYFVSAPWEDADLGTMLSEDGADWTLDARIALAESGFLEEVEPMIAIQYESIEYNSDPTDIRTTTGTLWDLSTNERAFAFLFGLAMDDDTAVNVTAYDDEQKSYPVVEDPSKAGLTALEEGPDPCGTSARIAKLVMGFDIFLEGGVA